MQTKVSRSQVIIEPHITEKSTALSADNKYVFKVHPKANKLEVRRAMREIYDVVPRDIRVMSVPGKKRRLGRTEGRKPGYKKAVVTLQEGDTIDLV